jgi:5-methylcytosine-specific restriction protein A
VIDDKYETLDSKVSFQNIEGIEGLVFESRSGGKNAIRRVNYDYNKALEVVLSRLIEIPEIEKINIYLASNKGKTNSKPLKERIISIDNNTDIFLKNYESIELRKKIGKEIQNIKKPESKGGNPTKRILITANLDIFKWSAVVKNESILEHNLGNINEKSDINQFSIMESVFENLYRNAMLKNYDYKCAITGCEIGVTLEVANLLPSIVKKEYKESDGILLRSDLKNLYDHDLIGINRDYEVVISDDLIETEYEQYNGKKIFLPIEDSKKPNINYWKQNSIPIRKK